MRLANIYLLVLNCITNFFQTSISNTNKRIVSNETISKKLGVGHDKKINLIHVKQNLT